MAVLMATGKRKDRDESVAEDEYMNADFILCSSAEVERLFSIGKYMLTDSRKNMAPIVFESLMYLRVNRRFWDQNLVIKAMAMAKVARAETRKKAQLEQRSVQLARNEAARNEPAPAARAAREAARDEAFEINDSDDSDEDVEVVEEDVDVDEDVGEEAEDDEY
jgi:hypothetical protein